jgi:ABC-type polysaccharide/polyol phosphate export permease
LLFYATPVLYPPSQLKGKGHLILVSNPVGQFVNLFRDLVYGLVPGSWGSWLYIFGWTVVTLAGAVWVFKKHGRDLSEEL